MTLYLRHRPNQLSDVFGNENAIASLRSLLKKKEDFPTAILIYGPTGCGKTTIARIIKKELGCKDEDFTELNMANTRGIDTIREIIQASNYGTFSGGAKIYLIDECFPGTTKVLIDYDKAVCIKDIVNYPHIKEVLSYDLQKHQILRKPISRKIKRRFSGTRVKLTLESNGKIYRSSCTASHKFFVINKGEVPAEKLVSGDKIVKFDGNVDKFYQCRSCGKLFKTQHILNGHIRSHYPFSHHIEGNCKYCGKYFRYVRQHEFRIHELSMIEKEKIGNKISSKLKGVSSDARKEACRKREREISPEKKSERIRNAVLGWKKTWGALPEEEKNRRRQRFISLPLNSSFPNKPEKKVIEMNVDKVEYTGDGSFWINLPDSSGGYKAKNPDFVVRERDQSGRIVKVVKYIEVMDREFWHKENYKEIADLYKRAGKDLLVLDAKDVLKNFEMSKAKLEAFVNNSYTIVKDVKVLHLTGKQHEGWVYNLEIKDTHNYFACAEGNDHLLPLLVSNCHKLTNDAQNALLKVLEDTPPKVYFILCTTDPEKVIATVRNRCSTFKVSTLPSFIISSLLEKVCKAEGKSIAKDVLKEITRVGKGSPRSSLNLLEKELDVDPKGALKELEDLDISESKTKDIIYLLLKSKSADKWEQMSKLIKNLEQFEPEAFRVGILNYFSKVLLGEEKVDGLHAGRVSLMMECFSQPFLYGGYGLLVNALFKASSI